MEALEADKKQMEEQFTIVNGDIEKLKEKEVLRKFLFLSTFQSIKFPIVHKLWQIIPRLAKVLVVQQLYYIASNHLHTECRNCLS